MPIESLTPQSAIDAYIERRLQAMEKAIIRNLQYVGETVVNHARSLPSPSASAFSSYPKIPPHQPHYIDWTANIRSSIGYVISVDGKIVENGGFIKTKGGEDGAKNGIRYAKDLVAKYPRGMVLIVVAGMNYASYVSAKGYDVIDSAELLADKLVPQMLRQIGF